MSKALKFVASCRLPTEWVEFHAIAKKVSELSNFKRWDKARSN